VIGDGAMSGRHGLRGAEPRRHALEADLLVVLNDNDMSISENVGALSRYFARVLGGKPHLRELREGGKKVLSQMPVVWELARRSRNT
jgi:1-deoxy-D-xylulose-5-phosphate synthase